ncbi:hypothetical protein MHYP_G00094280 [Metynnis hypsauchen]
MQRTFTWRRSWIAKHSTTMTEIFKIFFDSPRFLDMPNLLDAAFDKMHKGKEDLFIRHWEATIIPKLKAVAVLEKGDVAPLIEEMEDQTEDEMSYAMLVVLTQLPLVAAGRSIASLCDSQTSSQNHQPQLVCIGNLRSAARQYVLVERNDRITIPLEEGLTYAVDKLFKLYWVCNLAYPAQLSSVFSFH